MSLSGWRLLVVIALVALAGAVGGGIVGGGTAALMLQRQAPVASEPVPYDLPSPSAVLAAEDWDAVAAVARVGPAVVTVESSGFELPGLGTLNTSVGSGVIIDPRGFVVTNEHVVRQARSIRVVFANGERRTAKLVGSDYPYTDIALLKVEGPMPAVAQWGDSDALRVGQRLWAIGSALGKYPNTVTQGIASGLQRRWKSNGLVVEGLIQTDAAFNRGYSGGPLINIGGQVVGICTSVIRLTEADESVEGLGFALPSNTVREVVDQLIERGRVLRPYLGVSHRDVTPEIAAREGLPVKYGALVTSVGPDTPASRAGIAVGDVIVQMGQDAIGEEFPFLNALKNQTPRQEVRIVAYRDGEETILKGILEERR